jgi:hypothetical protein
MATPRSTLAIQGGVLKILILTILLPDSRKMYKNSIPASFLIFKKKMSRHSDNSEPKYGMKEPGWEVIKRKKKGLITIA